jgi:hypothetical protein
MVFSESIALNTFESWFLSSLNDSKDDKEERSSGSSEI